MATRWKLKGEWQFLLRETRTGNILAQLRPTESDGSGLEVRSSYPGEVTFAGAESMIVRFRSPYGKSFCLGSRTQLERCARGDTVLEVRCC